ncbi:MAG: type II toxin-antitoxin system RelE/ParE family toxin [Desulfotalea sp.]
MREIIFYESESGKSPVIEFIEELSSKDAQKTTWVLKLIQELPSVPTKYFKKLVNTDNIWEVRISSDHSIYRILSFFDGENLIVLNHAFQKKTQKTPRKAIKTAEKRKKNYLKRGSVK